jgi:hypothetical protein
MSKPLFRWTVGCCHQQGLDILAESINRTTRSLGLDNWDWAICHNGISRDDLAFLQKAIGSKPIQLIAQSWATCPVNDNMQTPRRRDGSFEWNGNRCGGTMWKVCPPRLRMESHEIVMDNDILLLKKFPQIDEFLASADKALILEEPIRFYGRYDCLFGSDTTYLNSGMMGFPPGYDYGTQIMANWVKHGSYMNLTQADEQGLLTYTLNQSPNIRIKKEQMVEVLHRDYQTKITGHEQAIHFTQANRMPNHHPWQEYQKIAAHNLAM